MEQQNKELAEDKVLILYLLNKIFDGIKNDNLYKIVGYCDYGVIGHPIWKILADMRMSGGRIHQPLAFIWSRLRV